MSATKALLIAGIVGATATLTGCPIVYRGYRGYDGRVLDAETGEALQGVRVVACLLDRYPGARQKDCASSPWKKNTLTDAEGRFAVDESRHVGIAVPLPHGFPGPYDTNLRFEKKGYESQELHWWRDREVLSRQPLIIHLDPLTRSLGSPSP
jgi:hypothetical protein